MTFAPRHPLSTGLRIALIAAVASAISALGVVYRARETERANPPTGKFIDVDGVCLHYRERGEGPPVVFLHGNGTMLQDFELSGVPALASAHYRVITFDRVGFGHSERPRNRNWGPQAQAALLRKAFERLGIIRPVVVAHSWATQVAIALALDYPAHVRSLVLLSGYYFPTFRLDAILLSMPAIPVIGDFMRYTISPWLGRLMWPGLVRKVFTPSVVAPRFAAFPKWMSLRPSQLRASAAESALMVPGALMLKRRYREISMPVFIMAGAGDRVVDTQQQSRRLHDVIAPSTLNIVPAAGHMIHHIVPLKVMELIDAAAGAAKPELARAF
jgi:pimeloyl-ACP methyl ester carboxylesterase